MVQNYTALQRKLNKVIQIRKNFNMKICRKTLLFKLTSTKIFGLLQELNQAILWT